MSYLFHKAAFLNFMVMHMITLKQKQNQGLTVEINQQLVRFDWVTKQP